MLTPQNSHTLFLMWLCPSPASSNPPSEERCFDEPTVILKNLKAQTVIAATSEHEVLLWVTGQGVLGAGWGRKGSFHPCLCPRRWLWFSLSFVPIYSQTHVTLVGLSWCFWLAVRLTQFLDPLTSILGPIILPCLATHALLGNTLLVEPGTDLHFFQLHSDIHFLLIDIC